VAASLRDVLAGHPETRRVPLGKVEKNGGHQCDDPAGLIEGYPGHREFPTEREIVAAEDTCAGDESDRSERLRGQVRVAGEAVVGDCT